MQRSKAIHVVSPSAAGVGSTTGSTLTPGGSSVCPRRVLGGWEWLRLEPVACATVKHCLPGTAEGLMNADVPCGKSRNSMPSFFVKTDTSRAIRLFNQ